jgi:hypothetical protein
VRTAPVDGLLKNLRRARAELTIYAHDRTIATLVSDSTDALSHWPEAGG